MAPTGSRGNTYSAQRLRLVLILLTAVTLPVVIGSSVLIYYYLRFSVMVDRRLQGERWMVPARLYGRPAVFKVGSVLDVPEVVKILNGMKYEEKKDIPAAAGEFAVGNTTVTFVPRGTASGGEAVLMTIDKGQIKDMRGLSTKKAYASLTLEPQLITYLFDESREKRRVVRYAEYPDHLIQAVLAIEDRRFFSHPGLDPVRILGAAARNVRAESYIQGGSTITQQLVKNFFLSPERTIRRKAQEALLAFVLERRASKQDILELYLNEIYLGQVGSFGISGMGEAARMYFHKDVGNLSIPEAALLAGMIQSPNPYNPYRHPDRATARRNQVIRAMQESGYIDAAATEAALKEPLKVENATLDAADAPYFVDLVRQQLAERYDQKDLATQNLAVYTSLDLPLQSLAQQVLSQGIARLDKAVKRKNLRPSGRADRHRPQHRARSSPSSAAAPTRRQYNRALRPAAAGLTFKPFVYLAAFEAPSTSPRTAITPATVVEDAPTVSSSKSRTRRRTTTRTTTRARHPARARSPTASTSPRSRSPSGGLRPRGNLWNKFGMGNRPNPIRPSPSASSRPRRSRSPPPTRSPQRRAECRPSRW